MREHIVSQGRQRPATVRDSVNFSFKHQRRRRTHRLGIQDLLHYRHTVGRRLSTSRPSPSQNVPTVETEGNGLGLNERRTSVSHVSERAQKTSIDEMGERGEARPHIEQRRVGHLRWTS